MEKIPKQFFTAEFMLKKGHTLLDMAFVIFLANLLAPKPQGLINVSTELKRNPGYLCQSILHDSRGTEASFIYGRIRGVKSSAALDLGALT